MRRSRRPEAIGTVSNSLGLYVKEQGLLALTLLLGVITLGTGRTTALQGIVHWSFSPRSCFSR